MVVHSDASWSSYLWICGKDLCLLVGADFSGEDLDARNEALDRSLEAVVSPRSRVSSHGSSGETVLIEVWLVWLPRVLFVDLERWSSRRARQ